MGRPSRITYPGSRHHVFNRAAGRQPLFSDDVDRKTFLALLRDAHDRCGAVAHAFCLMGNHYHLVLHTPNGELSAAMQFHASAYTRYFNRRHGRDGPLYRGRFASTVVAGDAHLLELTRYVHRNPLDIRPRVRLDAYRWSSYPTYLGDGTDPLWLDVASVLDMCGGRGSYRSYVEIDRTSDKTSGPPPPHVRADSASRPAPVASELLAAIDSAVRGCPVRGSSLPSMEPDESDRTIRLAALVVAAELGVRSSLLCDEYDYVSAAAARSAIRRGRARATHDEGFAELVQRITTAVDELVEP